jgi:hypothetical protein
MRLLRREPSCHLGHCGLPPCAVSRCQPEATCGATVPRPHARIGHRRSPRRRPPWIGQAAAQSQPVAPGPRLVKPGVDRRIEITLPHCRPHCPITFRRALITASYKRGQCRGRRARYSLKQGYKKAAQVIASITSFRNQVAKPEGQKKQETPALNPSLDCARGHCPFSLWTPSNPAAPPRRAHRFLHACYRMRPASNLPKGRPRERLEFSRRYSSRLYPAAEK